MKKVRNPDCYQGIALENTTFKIFTKILTKRLVTEVDRHIPECQFGFSKGRSTIHAVSYLLEQIEDALRHPGTKYYAIFIDYTKAFDLVNGAILINKLTNMIGDSNPLTAVTKKHSHLQQCPHIRREHLG